MNFKDYFKILGITPNSDEISIKQAYRKLSKKFHPDLNDGDRYFESMFKDVQEAYEILSNPTKKNAYLIKYHAFYSSKKPESTTQKNYNNSNSQNYSSRNTSGATSSDNTKKTPSSTVSKKRSSSAFYFIVIGMVIFIFVRLISTTNNQVYVNPDYLLQTSSQPIPVIDSHKIQPSVGVPIAQNFDSVKQIIEIQDTSNKLVNSQIENDGSNATKEETEQWILQKLRDYSNKLTTCTDDALHPSCSTESNYLFNFIGDYLQINYMLDDSMKCVYKILISDFQSVSNRYSKIYITAQKKSIVCINLGRNTRFVSPICSIGFNTDAETDLCERLELAFKHLKHFYPPPLNNEAF